MRDRLFGEHRYHSPAPTLVEKLLEQAALSAGHEESVIEIRCHGRAGQGLITSGVLLAEAALREGKYIQAFPEFGPERSGAPMEAFIRISPDPIHIHAPITQPGMVMVLDATLLTQISVFHGMGEEAIAVVNHTATPDALRGSVDEIQRVNLVTVDASGIALEILKRPFPNMPMLGAMLRASPIVSPELMADVIVRGLEKRLTPDMVAANRLAFWEGHKRANVSWVQEQKKEVQS